MRTIAVFFILGVCFSVHAESDRKVTLKDGTQIQFDSIELHENGYLVRSGGNSMVIPSNSKVTLCYIGTCKVNPNYFSKIQSQEPPKQVKNQVKWNLPCPPPKVLPRQKTYG